MPLTAVPAPPDLLADLVAALKEAWRRGEPPDAARAIREHPDLLRRRTLVVDLAYEEYCLLDEAGCPPEPEEFCRRLPAFGSQVREVIRGHRELAEHPELFARGAAAWPEPGDFFEELVIVRELGRGAFARAYLATDTGAGDRRVVLKLSRSPSEEARTLGPRVHPHVVGVLWARQVDGWHAICMPYVGSATLGDVLEVAFREPLTSPPRSARAILGAIEPAADPASELQPLLGGRESFPDAVAALGARLAGALAYLGRSGVTHGDIKPSNVILGPGGHPYLIDFNLSTGLDESLHRFGGTLPYMAPERLRHLLGEWGGEAPAAADVYSLGVVLFEALTGRVPFRTDGPPLPEFVAEELLFLQAGGVPGVRAANPSVPPALARLVERCLAADPAKRPTAASLARELEHHLRRGTRRARLLSLAGAALVGVGLSAWQVLAAPAPAPSIPPPPPSAPAPPAVPTTAEEFFDRGVQFLRAGDVNPAVKDFGEAHQRRPDPRTRAFIAYCEARRANPRSAAAYYDDVMRQGYNLAWVHNNRAAALIKMGSAANLRDAIREATEALDLEPALRAARFNRAVARYHLNIDRNFKLADPDCLADLNAVMETGPYSPDLYYKAALILAASGDGNEAQLSRAVSYVREVLLLGKSFQQLAGNPVLKRHLGERDDFRALASMLVSTPPQAPVALDVIDPLSQ
jgi:serine/threonine protein kinase